jgi:hypothetical protein
MKIYNDWCKICDENEQCFHQDMMSAGTCPKANKLDKEIEEIINEKNNS